MFKHLSINLYRSTLNKQCNTLYTIILSNLLLISTSKKSPDNKCIFFICLSSIILFNLSPSIPVTEFTKYDIGIVKIPIPLPISKTLSLDFNCNFCITS